ncbi:MAG: hypothetical protein JNM13_09075 [Hyphomicrobiaceae bacterium]|nr:hypothetical protein [Hyphomicrobiaceae bacterium]
MSGMTLGLADAALRANGVGVWRVPTRGLGFFGGDVAADAPVPAAVREPDCVAEPATESTAACAAGPAPVMAADPIVSPSSLDPIPSPAVTEAPAAPLVERPKGIVRPRGGKPDDLKMVGGISPKIEKILNDLGFFHFDQVAAWTPAQVEWVDNYTNSRGRITRESWISQADALAVGGRDEYVRRFGKVPRKS